MTLALVCLCAVALGVWGSESRRLAAELGIGIMAANLAFGWLDESSTRWRNPLRALFAVANLGALFVATTRLGADGLAWAFAIPALLVVPRRNPAGSLLTWSYILAVVAVVLVGRLLAGAEVMGTAAIAVALLAVGVAPSASQSAIDTYRALRYTKLELEAQRAARAEAEAEERRVRAQLRDEGRRLQSEAELTAEFEERFAAVERRHDQILAAIVDAVLTVDTEGTITSANPAAEEILRASRAEIIGSPLTSFVPKASRRMLDVIQSSPGEAFDTVRVLKTREFLCMRQDGSVVEVELGVGAFTGESAGLETGRTGEEVLTVVLRDISARKRVERMKDELVSTVSHELRTPLTAIIGSIGLLNGGASGPMSPKAVELLAVAERNGQRLLALIDDILDIQKMEAGKLEFCMTRLDLAEVVKRAVDTTRPMAESREVAYRFRTTGGLPTAWADPGRLEQVVANLLSNATKHAPRGSTIEVRVDAPAADRLRVQVKDKGPGLDESMMGRVFERFEQGDMGDTRQSGGTGLGLAIARAIVQRHGGEIGVESEPGQGANFYFELPTAAALGRTGGPSPSLAPPAEFS